MNETKVPVKVGQVYVRPYCNLFWVVVSKSKKGTDNFRLELMQINIDIDEFTAIKRLFSGVFTTQAIFKHFILYGDLTAGGGGNFTTNVGAGTLEYLQKISPISGRLIDTLVTLYRVEHNHTTLDYVSKFIEDNLGCQ